MVRLKDGEGKVGVRGTDLVKVGGVETRAHFGSEGGTNLALLEELPIDFPEEGVTLNRQFTALTHYTA